MASQHAGTMCKYIMEERGITVPPIETSTLFDRWRPCTCERSALPTA